MLCHCLYYRVDFKYLSGYSDKISLTNMYHGGPSSYTTSAWIHRNYDGFPPTYSHFPNKSQNTLLSVGLSTSNMIPQHNCSIFYSGETKSVLAY